MSDVNPPLAFERGMERLTLLWIFNNEPYFFLELLVPCRTLGPELLAGGSQIGINDDLIAHASISLKKSSMELYFFPLPFLISAWAFFSFLISSGLIADSGG